MNMIRENVFVFLLIIGSSLSHNIVIREISYNDEGDASADTSVAVVEKTAETGGSGEGSGTEPPLVAGDETLDVSLTFDQAWSDDLADPTSQAYQDAVDQANSAVKTMTGWDSADLSGVEWTFTEGSVVATATVPVFGTDSAADVEARLASFDTTTIPGLASVAAQVPITGCATQVMPTNGAVLSCTDGYLVASVCSFSCVDGFYIVGSSALTCGADGNWDAAAPVCSDDPTTTEPAPTTTTTVPPTTPTPLPVTQTTSGSSATKGIFTVLMVSTLLALQNALF